MQKGIGIDIIEINRIKSSVKQYKDKFLKKVFTDREIIYCTKKRALKFPELAARFAAKEAYSKAIGTGLKGINWKEIEIINCNNGKPQIYINKKLNRKALVSLSHIKNYAAAVVLVS